MGEISFSSFLTKLNNLRNLPKEAYLYSLADLRHRLRNFIRAAEKYCFASSMQKC